MAQPDFTNVLNQFMADASTGQYTDEQLMEAYPEFNNDPAMLDAAYSYMATVQAKKYDEQTLQKKFPEFFSSTEEILQDATAAANAAKAQQMQNIPMLGEFGKPQEQAPDWKFGALQQAGMSEKEQSMLPQGYAVMNQQERAAAEMQAKHDALGSATQNEANLPAQSKARDDEQKANASNEIRMAGSTSPEELVENVNLAWKKTDAGIRRSAQLEREVQAVMDKFQKEKQDEFTKNPNVQAIVASYQNGTLNEAEANDAIQDLWEKMYSEELNERVRPYQESYQNALYEANKEVFEEEVNRMARNNLNGDIAVTKDVIEQLRAVRWKDKEPRYSPRIYTTQGPQRPMGMQYDVNHLDPLRAAENLNRKARMMMEAGAWKKGFKGGVGDAVKDPNTWDFGLGELNEAAVIIELVRKSEAGEELTEEEVAALDATLEYVSAQAMNAGLLSRWYKAGQVTGMSIPFLIQFAIIPMEGIKNATIRGLRRYAVRKLEQRALRKGVKFIEKEAIGKGLDLGIRALGSVAGSVAASAALTGTLGMPKVLAGSIERTTGTLKAPDLFAGGEHLQYAGTLGDQQGYVEAAFNSGIEVGADYLSEMIINGLGAGALELAAWKLGKTGVGGFFKVANTFMKNNPVAKFLHDMQAGGLLEEFTEEEIAKVISTVQTDVTWKDAFTADDQIDTFCGLLPMQLAFFGARGVGMTGSMLKAKLKGIAFENKLSADGKAALKTLNEAKDNNAASEALKAYRAQLLKEGNLSQEEREEAITKALADYVDKFDKREVNTKREEEKPVGHPDTTNWMKYDIEEGEQVAPISDEEREDVDKIMLENPSLSAIEEGLGVDNVSARALYNDYIDRHIVQPEAPVPEEGVAPVATGQDDESGESGLEFKKKKTKKKKEINLEEAPVEAQAAPITQTTAESPVIMTSEPVAESKRPETIALNGAERPIVFSGRKVVYNDDGSINEAMSSAIYFADPNVIDENGEPALIKGDHKEMMAALNETLRAKRKQMREQQVDTVGEQRKEFGGQQPQPAKIPIPATTEQQTEQTQQQEGEQAQGNQQSQFPVDENGNTDFKNMTPQQQVEYNAQTYGPQGALTTIDIAIADLEDNTKRTLRDPNKTPGEKAAIQLQNQAAIAEWQALRDQYAPQGEVAPEAPVAPVQPEKPKVEKKPEEKPKQPQKPKAEKPAEPAPAAPAAEPETKEPEGEKPKEKTPEQPETPERTIDLSDQNTLIMYDIHKHTYHLAKREGDTIVSIDGSPAKESWREIPKRQVAVEGEEDKVYYLLAPTSTTEDSLQSTRRSTIEAMDVAGNRVQLDPRGLVKVGEGWEYPNKHLRKEIKTDETKEGKELKKNAKGINDVLDFVVISYKDTEGKMKAVTLRNLLGSTIMENPNSDGTKVFTGSNRLDMFVAKLRNDMAEDEPKRGTIYQELNRRMVEAINAWNKLAGESEKLNENEVSQVEEESSFLPKKKIDVTKVVDKKSSGKRTISQSLSLIQHLREMIDGLNTLEKESGQVFMKQKDALFAEEINKTRAQMLGDKINRKKAEAKKAREEKAAAERAAKKDAKKKTAEKPAEPAPVMEKDAKANWKAVQSITEKDARKVLGRRGTRVFLRMQKLAERPSIDELIKALIAGKVSVEAAEKVSMMLRMKMKPEYLKEHGVKTAAELEKEISVAEKVADKFEEATGTPSEIVKDNEIPDAQARKAVREGRRVYGWYANGKVYIVESANTSERRAMETLFHEAVAHKGLRDMLGDDKFRNLCKQVWKGMSANERLRMIAYAYLNNPSSRPEGVTANSFAELQKDAIAYGKVVNSEELQEIAADEYMAHLAQRFINIGERDTSTFANRVRKQWQNFCNRLREILGKIGINIPMTDAGIARYIHESYENMVAGNPRKGLPHDAVRYLAMGERGARGMDRIFATSNKMKNLAVAKEMEAKGYAPLNIKIATGWEKGADGMWRIETNPVNINKKGAVAIIVKDGAIDRGCMLEELIDNPEVFAAYPKLRKTTVEFSDGLAGLDGCYIKEDNKLLLDSSFIDAIKGEKYKELRETLEHEVQHAIQFLEGFGEGYSLERAAADVKEGLLNELHMMEDELMRREANILKFLGRKKKDFDNFFNTEWNKGNYRGGGGRRAAFFDYVGDNLPDYQNPDDYDEINVRSDEYEQLSIALDKLLSRMDNVVKMAKGEKVDKYDKEVVENYRGHSGEAESRAMEDRLFMSPEERLITLIEDSEDIARKDQTVLINGVRSESKGGAAVDKILHLVEEKLGKLSPERRAIVTRFANRFYSGVETFAPDNENWQVEAEFWDGIEQLRDYMNSLTDAKDVEQTQEIIDAIIDNDKSIIEQAEINNAKSIDTAAIERTQREMQAIKEQAIKDGTFMMSPKGVPTKLTEEQWLRVRTSAFKAWFGDWENDPENSSKVLDPETGEPMIVYRGSSNANSFLLHHGPTEGFFFTPEREVAKTYVPYGKSEEELEDYVQPFFLNIRDIDEFDAKGENWSDLPIPPKYSVIGTGMRFETREEALEFVQNNPDYLKENTIGMDESEINEIPQLNEDSIYEINTSTTDSIYRESIEHGSDGIVFRNVIDTVGDPMVADVYVVPDNTSAKSATKAVGSYSNQDKDTRYSVEMDEEIPEGPVEAMPLGLVNKLTHAIGDQAEGVRKMQREIEKITGKKITYDKDVREWFEHGVAIVDSTIKRFHSGPWRRLGKQMSNIMSGKWYQAGRFEKNGLWHKGMKDTYTNKAGKSQEIEVTKLDVLERYLMAKDNLQRIEMNKARMTELAARLRQQMGIKEEMSDAEALQAYVDLFESKYSPSEINALWKSIKECTDFTLDWLLKGGMIGQKEYEEYKNRKFYVPERGFAGLKANENIREELHGFGKWFGRGRNKAAATIEAEGGESMATDVIANIMYLALNSVQCARENMTKKALFDMMNDNLEAIKQMGYPVPQKVWYVRDGVNEDGTPRYKAQMENPSDEMVRVNDEVVQTIKELQEDLEAYKNNKAMREHIEGLIADAKKQLLIVPKQMAGSASLDVAKLAGEVIPKVIVNIPNAEGYHTQYSMSFPNQPEIANCLNGVLGNKYDDWLQKYFNGFIGRVVTVFNPFFPLYNIPKDLFMATHKGIAERGLTYPAFVLENLVKPNGLIPIIEYASGLDVEGRKKGLTKDNIMEREFYEFLEAGGNNGMTQINNVERYRREAARMGRPSIVRNVGVGLGFMITKLSPALNEVFELWTRFAVYRATKRMLTMDNKFKSKPLSEKQIIAEAAHDSLNFSGNFIRKGAGNFITFFNSLSLFANPAIQGASSVFRSFETPAKAARGVVGFMLLPAIYGFLSTMLSPDDPDKEEVIPDYIRENYLIFLNYRVPIAHELVPFFRIGVYYALIMQGKKTTYQATESVARGFVENNLPVAPIISNTASEMIDYMMTKDDDYSTKSKQGAEIFIQLLYSQGLKRILEIEENKTWTGATLRNEYAGAHPQYLYYQDEPKIFLDWSKWLYEQGEGSLNVPSVYKTGKIDEKINPSFDKSARELHSITGVFTPSGWGEIINAIYESESVDKLRPERYKKAEIPFEDRPKTNIIKKKFELDFNPEIYEYTVMREMRAMLKAYDYKMKNLEEIFKGLPKEKAQAAVESMQELTAQMEQMPIDERIAFMEETVEQAKKNHVDNVLMDAYLTNLNLVKDGWTPNSMAAWRKLVSTYDDLNIYKIAMKKGKTKAEFIADTRDATGYDFDDSVEFSELKKAVVQATMEEILRVKGFESEMPKIQRQLINSKFLPVSDRAKEALKSYEKKLEEQELLQKELEAQKQRGVAELDESIERLQQ